MDLNYRVIGGRHHGESRERYDMKPGDRMYLWEPANRSPGAVSYGYRLTLFSTHNRPYLVWIPQEVPEHRAVEHVLELALRADASAGEKELEEMGVGI